MALLGGAAPLWAARSQLSERKSYDFPLRPNGRVELKNLSGAIRVERWDEPRVTVEVEKVGKGRTEEEIRQAFEDWALEVDNRPDRVSIEADLVGSGRGWSYWDDRRAEVAFHFAAKVPRDAALDISSINGEQIEILGSGDGLIDARNVNGDVHYKGSGKALDLSTVNGDVTAEIDLLRPDADLKLETVNGSIRLFLPQEAQADLRVESLSGMLYTNLDLPHETIESFIGFKYQATLGGGGGNVRLETVHGPVRILKLGSAPTAGDRVVTLQHKSIVIPPIQIDSQEISEAVREAVESAREVAREAAREARRAAREGAEAAREAARESARATREAVRETRRHVRRHWDWDTEDEKAVRIAGTVAGDLQIRDSNEDIVVGQIEGNASLVTFAGDIQVRGVGGEGKLLTYGGEIQVGRAAKALEAETYGGDILVEQADGPIVLKTKGGDIRVQAAAAAVRVETLGGDIDLRNLSGPIHARTNGGEVRARLKTPLSEGEILLESLGGDVGLVLPKGMGASVRIEIRVPRREANEHFLETNLPGLQRTVEDAEGGDVRIVYSGAVHGGGPSVTLRTHSGEVSLREAPSP
jgi:DUF4097 and DUF4098 domain-containing protein YvlB